MWFLTQVSKFDITWGNVQLNLNENILERVTRVIKNNVHTHTKHTYTHTLTHLREYIEGERTSK